MYRFGQIFELLLILPKRRRIKQPTLYHWLLGYDDAAVSSGDPIPTLIKQGNREVPRDLKDKIISAEVKDYANYLEKELDYLYTPSNRYVFVCKTAQVLQGSDPAGLETILGCINKKYEAIKRERERFPFFDYLASLVKHSLATVPNAINPKNKKKKTAPDWINDYTFPPDYFDLIDDGKLPVTIPFSLNRNRFDEIFKLQRHADVQVGDKTSSLNIFTLPLVGESFDYDVFTEFFQISVGSFALSRRQKSEMEESDERKQLIALKAVKHIRNKYPDSSTRRKVVVEFLLHAFMECGLCAPKIFTNVELNSSDDMGADCGGIYLLHEGDVSQLVFGLSFADESPQEAMERVIDCSIAIRNQFPTISKNVDSALLSKLFSNDMASMIAEFIIPKQQVGKASSISRSFGVFIGYEADMKDGEAILQCGGYNQYASLRLQRRIAELEEAFRRIVIKKGMFGYSYYIYLLPFSELESNLDSLIEEVLG